MPHKPHKALLASARLLLLTSALGLIAAAPASASSPSFPTSYSAPYLQLAASTAPDMLADMSATGDKYYTLAFITPLTGCIPEWEDNPDRVDAFTSQVSALQRAGGNVIISFGGASGGELAQTCTSVSRLRDTYAMIARTYHANRLDFDIEADVIHDKAAIARRDEALAELQAREPGLQIDFTLPVNPTGLPEDGLYVLADAKRHGVKVNLVNIMTMDFGNGQPVLDDARSAAITTAAQLAALYGISTSAAYAKLGLTPIAGKNDDDEVFTLRDAQILEEFAAAHGVQELSFWEVDAYDLPVGFAYSQIFERITAG